MVNDYVIKISNSEIQLLESYENQTKLLNDKLKAE